MDNVRVNGLALQRKEQITRSMKAESSSALFFEILAPKAWTAPVVFNSPHSGNIYPEQLLGLTRLSPRALRKSEDCYIDELFEACLDQGAPLLRALVPRAYIDFNREPYELDPRMFHGELPGYFNTASPRVAGGLGTIPKLVAEGEEIYREKLHLADALHRIDSIYRPYHRTLKALLDEVHQRTGAVLLIDCHSMPASAAQRTRRSRNGNVDIVLGDRFGASCPEQITSFFESLCEAQGLSVVRNTPYAGGFITQTHGVPVNGRFALQIEINRSLYMNEATLEKNAGFKNLKASLTRITAALNQAMAEFTQPDKIAAE